MFISLIAGEPVKREEGFPANGRAPGGPFFLSGAD
jgi:hypothetical protein